MMAGSDLPAPRRLETTWWPKLFNRWPLGRARADYRHSKMLLSWEPLRRSAVIDLLGQLLGHRRSQQRVPLHADRDEIHQGTSGETTQRET